MAHPSPSDQRLCSPRVLRLVLVLMGLLLVGSIMGRSLYSYSKKSIVSRTSCPSCDCDCSSDDSLSMSSGFLNSSMADCGEHDPDMNKEMKKDIITLLSEEINLQRNVTSDSLEHTKALIMDAKKTSSHYQKEAEKCNVGMETCEEAREKAEAALIEERKLSELWEKRAHEHGWDDKRRAYSLI